MLGRQKPLPSLIPTQEAAEVMSLIRPPLLTADATADGFYVVLANARVIQWHRREVGQDPAFHAPVRCLILSGDLGALEKLGDIEAHLVPLLLGEMSVRATQTARRTLKEAGVARPRKKPARDRLQQSLVKR